MRINKSLFFPLLDGRCDGSDGFGLMRVDVQNRFVGAAGNSGNQDAFDNLVRRFCQQNAVFECTRFVFVGIADDVVCRHFALGGNGSLPFAPGRETCATHTAKIGFLPVWKQCFEDRQAPPTGLRRRQLYAMRLNLRRLGGKGAVSFDWLDS